MWTIFVYQNRSSMNLLGTCKMYDLNIVRIPKAIPGGARSQTSEGVVFFNNPIVTRGPNHEKFNSICFKIDGVCVSTKLPRGATTVYYVIRTHLGPKLRRPTQLCIGACPEQLWLVPPPVSHSRPAVMCPSALSAHRLVAWSAAASAAPGHFHTRSGSSCR